MADADEDAIRHPSHNSTQIETDLSDETQDFRFLNNISLFSDPTQASIPKRGEKDFEPNPTIFQADVLSASRQAMHNALAFPRLHNPKHNIVGIYAPDGPFAPSPSSSQETKSQPKTGGNVTGTIGVSPNTCVYVTNPKGQYFKTMGQADRWNRVWLLPEEALYLLERGSLDIRWPVSLTSPSAAGEDGKKEEKEEPTFPMSLQAAYACLIGRGGLTPERFSVYTGLRRLGYTLIRAPSWDETDDNEVAGAGVEGDSSSSATTSVSCVDLSRQQSQGLLGLLGRMFQWIYESNSTASTPAGPVVGLGIHRSYNDIYRKLSLIPWYDPVTASSDSPTTKRTATKTTPPFRVAFNVYKPSTPFRKSSPPDPDFRIAVINARTQTSIPTSSQLGALLETTPLDPPRGEKMSRLLYLRLRHGYRNVILAVVDQGVVSYLRMGDAAFGKERIYEEKGGLRNKGGSRPRQRRR